MKRFIPILALLIWTAATPAKATVNQWAFTIPVICETFLGGASGDGAFSATLSSQGVTLTGWCTTYANGWTKFTITSQTPSNILAGTTTFYGFRIPNFMWVFNKILPTETQLVFSMISPTCAAIDKTYGWLFNHWTGSSNDPTSSTQSVGGLMSTSMATSAVTISQIYKGFLNASPDNVTTFAWAPNWWNAALQGSGMALAAGGSCSNGKFTVAGAGDRGGDFYFNNYGVFYASNADHTVIGMKQTAIGSVTDLNGRYYGYRYTSPSSGAVSNIRPMKVIIDSTGLAGASTPYSDPSAGTFEAGTTDETITITAINTPSNGFAYGTITLGANAPSKVICVALPNYENSGYKAIFCGGSDPETPTLPYNILLTEAKESPGSLDKTFGTSNSGGVVISQCTAASKADMVAGAVIDTSDNIYVGGFTQDATASTSDRDWTVSKLTSVGTIDTGFGASGTVTSEMSAIGSSDLSIDQVMDLGYQVVSGTSYVIAVGYSQFSEGGGCSGAGCTLEDASTVARYSAAGVKDAGWASGKLMLAFSGGKKKDRLLAVSVNNTIGKIAVVGYNELTAGTTASTNSAIGVINANGTLDTGFNAAGTLTAVPGLVYRDFSGASTSDKAVAVKLLDSGKVLVFGQATGTTYYLAQYTAAGALDTANFGSPNGFITGYWQTSGKAQTAKSMAVDATGRIYIVGEVVNAADTWFHVGVARYTSAGALDTTFNSGGTRPGVNIISSLPTTLITTETTDAPSHILIQPNQKPVIVGSSGHGVNVQVETDSAADPANDGSQWSYALIIRLTTDGTLDTPFGDGGIVLNSFGGDAKVNNTMSVAKRGMLAKDGNVIVAGHTHVTDAASGSGWDYFLMRFWP